MYPAQDGDALLLTNGGLDPAAILIDGGYSATFASRILSDLNTLRSCGQRLNLVVATHIDADHISGLLKFFRENGNASAPKIIGVDDVWHNSLRSITGCPTETGKISQGDREIIEEIVQHGLPPTGASNEGEEISASQGSSLAAALLAGGYRWNGDDGSTAISNHAAPRRILSESVSVRIVGPLQQRLVALSDWWIRELRRLGFSGPLTPGEMFDDAFEFLCAWESRHQVSEPVMISNHTTGDPDLAQIYKPDKSVTNGSSIATIVTMDSRRVLLLGDAWSADTEAALRELKECGEPLLFDALKISHHGSARNTSPTFLELADANHFLISADGESNGHPDAAVLRAIVDRPAKFERHLHFNYETEAANVMRTYQSKSGSPFQVHVDGGAWIDLP